ncbi:MAG: hypothetical protein AAGB01_01680 [Cyanobacteria bacterium P01_F01_bin.42]
MHQLSTERLRSPYLYGLISVMWTTLIQAYTWLLGLEVRRSTPNATFLSWGYLPRRLIDVVEDAWLDQTSIF